MPRFNDSFYDGIIKVTVELNKHNINYKEKSKGIIIVKGVKFYSHSETWTDTLTKEHGKGIESFINYIKNYHKTTT